MPDAPPGFSLRSPTAERRRGQIRLMAVYGALRSGTTMLRLMLNGHPALRCPGESDYFFDHLEIGDDGRVTLDIEALRRSRFFQADHETVEVADDPLDVLDEMLVRLAGPPSGEADLTFVFMLHRGLEKAIRIFPDIKVVHMLRDPRDVARSSIGMGWAGTVYHGVDHWIRTEAEWDRAALRIPPDQKMELRYEQLVSQDRAVLEAFCTFAGLSFDPLMLDYDRHTTYGRPDAQLAEQWRQQVSPRDLALVEGRLGGLLAARGYQPSGHAPVTPGPLWRLWLGMLNRGRYWRRRISRYGLVDPLLVSLARRLGAPGLGFGAQARIDAKVKRYIR